MPELRPVKTPAAPDPNGHYSQAIVDGHLVFVSMQLPICASGKIEHISSCEQARQVIVNCEKILEAAGSSLPQVLSVTIFLTTIDDWSEVDGAFAKLFEEHRPARALIGVQALHLGAKVGMQMVAACSKRGNSSIAAREAAQSCFASFR